jgi:hypothetical protein
VEMIQGQRETVSPYTPPLFSNLGSLFYPEDGHSTFIRNVNKHLPYYTASHPRKQYLQKTTNSASSSVTKKSTFAKLRHNNKKFTDIATKIVIGVGNS